MDQNQKFRERTLIRELVPDWRPTRGQVLWIIRSAIVLVGVLGMLTLIGIPFGVTLWDWLDLLIVPVVLAIGGYLFTRSENQVTQAATERRAQDEALQAYLDKMTELLVHQNLGERPDSEDELNKDPARTVAWARTKTVLRRLDGDRKGAVLRFLREAELIKKDHPVIRSLAGADLAGANLEESVLENTALEEVILREAVLRGAVLTGTVLRKADLTDADLKEADLTKTDLTGAQVTEKQLAAAKSLEGATRPNGQKYEDWLKSKGRRENGEDGGPL